MECNKNINELTVNTIIYYIYLQYRENMILFNIYIYIYVKTRVSIERIDQFLVEHIFTTILKVVKVNIFKIQFK